MSKILSKYDEIPESPYYVIGHDTFMSGWGLAKNKENWVLFLCNSDEEAEIVLQSCKDRTDIAKAYLLSSDNEDDIPHLETIIYSKDTLISLMDRDDCSRWYEKDGFANLRD